MPGMRGTAGFSATSRWEGAAHLSVSRLRAPRPYERPSDNRLAGGGTRQGPSKADLVGSVSLFWPYSYSLPTGRSHPKPSLQVQHVTERDQFGAVLDGNCCWWVDHRAIADLKQRGVSFFGDIIQNIAQLQNHGCSILLR